MSVDLATFIYPRVNNKGRWVMYPRSSRLFPSPCVRARRRETNFRRCQSNAERVIMHDPVKGIAAKKDVRSETTKGPKMKTYFLFDIAQQSIPAHTFPGNFSVVW